MFEQEGERKKNLDVPVTSMIKEAVIQETGVKINKL